MCELSKIIIYHHISIKRFPALICILTFLFTVKLFGLPVTNFTKQQGYSTISAAVSNASNGNYIQVAAGTYNESITIVNLTNLTLEATEWASNSVNTNTIIDGTGYENAINITNSKNITIQGFSITKSISNGIYIYNNSISNIISHNQIYSNRYKGGIYAYGDAIDYNIIKSNIIYGVTNSTLSCGFGIGIEKGDNNVITGNKLYDTFVGIYLWWGADNNVITNNYTYASNGRGILIASGENNRVISNHFAYNNFGIEIWGNSKYNIIQNNRSYSNKTLGIYIYNGYSWGSVVSNYCIGNIIYDTKTGINVQGTNGYNNYIISNQIKVQNKGIKIKDSINNIYRGNNISTASNGIYIEGISTNNIISHNAIYSNEKYGIVIFSNSAQNNKICSNTIQGGNQNYGIYIFNADNNTIKSNRILDNDICGIYISGATNTKIEYNIIANQTTGTGVNARYSVLNVKLNSITNNDVGVYIGINVLFTNIIKNNIYNNTTRNLETLIPCPLTNNWWGTTILSSIRAKVSSINETNLIPYRLFGPFDITEGADTTSLPIVSWVTAYQSGFSNVVVEWSNVSGSDFGYYRIYRSTNSGFSNLGSVDVIVQISNQGSVPGVTGYTDTVSSSGIYYYHLTAVDTNSSYPNECWYSEEAVVSVIIHSLNITKATDVGGTFSTYSNNLVMVVSITDSWGDTLTGFSVGNAGTMLQPDILAVKLWYDADNDKTYGTNDIFVSDLIYDTTSLWTNNNISFATSLSPARQFLVTLDLVGTIDENSGGFQAYIPANGVQCSGGAQSPASAITNATNVSVGQYIGTAFGIGVKAASIVLGDIDTDGDLDFITTGQSIDGTNRLEKYINDGTGNFTNSIKFGSGIFSSSTALGDIDADGDLDLVVTGYDGSLYHLDKYINDGTGNFTGPTSFGTGVRSSSIVLGDVDNDGDLDLIVTGYDGSLYHLDKYINDGTGNFTGPTAFGTSVYVSSIGLGDIDADGDLDLVVTGYEGGIYHLDKYINDGSGTFTGPTSFGIGVDYSSIAIGDIDNDGDLDLIVTGYDGTGRHLDKYINDGSGTFTGPTSFGTGVWYSSISLGDIDNDGDLDLIVTGDDNGGIKHLDKYINDGSGNFTGVNLSPGVYSSSIALGDIDNDGDMDFVVNGQAEDGSYRLDKYINLETTINTPPSIPAGMSTDGSTGYWWLQWNQAIDDNTPANMLRYQIAIGTNSGVYDYASTNIDYPRGQANIGRVTIVTGTPYYQTKITNIKYVYWKVCAIDSAFKNSAYCSEQIGIPPDVFPPKISNLSLSTNPVLSTATAWTLYFTANDNGLGNSTIQTGIARIGSTNGTTYPVYAFDGAYDSTNEQLYCALNPSALGWNPGDLIRIFIKAQDASGNWSVWSNVVVGVITNIPPSEPTRWQHIKYAKNPVFKRGPGGSFDDVHAFNPCILNINGTNKMWYGGYDGSGNYRRGYAYSSNGIDWQGRQLVLNFTQPWEETSIGDSSVLFDTIANKYKMWYIGGSTLPRDIGYAESYDGINWTKAGENLNGIDLTAYSNPVLVGTPGEFDSNSCLDVFVMKESGLYKMWYGGYDGVKQTIGYATSTNGIDWIKYSGNPVIYTNQSWETGGFADKSVLKYNNIYYIWYGNTEQKIGCAFSYDGINWNKLANNPVMMNDTSFDSSRCYLPTVVKEGANYRIWYSGHNGSYAEIGYACIDFEGPTTTTATLINAPNNAITTVADYTLRAFVSDETNGCLHIVDAEYFLDYNPTTGDFGTGTNIGAITNNNGGFSNRYETFVQAVISSNLIATLPAGTHYLYIHGRDASTNNATYKGWGDVYILPFTVTFGPAQTPLSLSANTVSSNSIVLSWQDSVNETAYFVYRNTNNNTNTANLIATNPQDNTNYTSTSLTPNRQYYFRVKATNTIGASGFSTAASNYTYAVAPKIVGNKQTGTVWTNNIFIFTNKAIVGDGGIQGYYYNWSKLSSENVTNTDVQWIPTGIGDVITNIATNEGEWYLHIRSYNSDGALYYQIDYGAYKYYSEYVGLFELEASKPRITPDGVDYAEIRNKDILTNQWTGMPISGNSVFYIEILKGSCDIEAEMMNGKYYVQSSNGGINFKVRGNVINNVEIRVYWEGDSNITANVNLLISPEMDIGDNNDAIVYNTIINPDRGEGLEMYINSEEGEEIEIHIYDIKRERLVKKLEVRGGMLKPVEWDLKMDNGNYLPDGSFGIVVRGENWCKEVKFIVSRWYK